MKPTDYLSTDEIEVIRQRTFDLDAKDSSMDNEINQMSTYQIASVLCGWELGSDSWLDSFIEWCALATNRDADEVRMLIFDE